MRLLPIFLIPILVGVAACDGAPPPSAPAQPVPRQLCDQVAKSLKPLGDKGGVEYDEKGNATMLGEAWTAMSADQRDQLVRLLAYHASCAAGAENDAQLVVVRDDEGQELARRTVSTKVDVAGALGMQGQDIAR
jgi:hypothetical protein